MKSSIFGGPYESKTKAHLLKRTLTVCPYCGTGCTFYLVSDNGRLVGVEPSVEGGVVHEVRGAAGAVGQHPRRDAIRVDQLGHVLLDDHRGPDSGDCGADGSGIAEVEGDTAALGLVRTGCGGLDDDG